MITAVAGDPGSCSGLGGALCTVAARLTESSVDLDPGGLHRKRVLEVAESLHDAGSRLQVYAQELAELSASAERLHARVTAAGLHLHGFRVLEPAGVVEISDAQRRIRARPQLQASADRIAARLGRCRADLVRSFDRAAATLSGLPFARG